MLRAIILVIGLGLSAIAQAEQIPLESFAKLPSFVNPKISPDGKYMAVQRVVEGESTIVVQPLKLSEKETQSDVAVLNVGKYYINWYTWANNDRIILSLRDTQKVFGDQWSYSRLVSVDRRGTDVTNFRMRPNQHGFYKQYPTINHLLPKDDDHVLLELDNDDIHWGAPQVHKVNLYTGKRELIQKSTKNIHDFYSDYDGNVRVGVRYPTHGRKTNVVTYYKPTADAKWQELGKVDYFDNARLVPHRFDEHDNNTLIVYNETLAESSEEEIESKLFKYDLTKQEITGPYIDQGLRDIRKMVEKALPDTDVSLHDYNRDRSRFIFSVSADLHPTRYYVLDTKIPAFSFLSSEQPALEDQQMAAMLKIDYDARDGLNIPAYLTLPPSLKDNQKAPMIVLPHGGPWARDYWGFDNYVQYFANRGYAVLQPQFRGSTGFGIEHEEAGYKQWGAAIQDDITDGVHFVLENYNIDKDRICIVGASFGGYAAAMGLAKTPDLYRCGISINGVLNLPKMIKAGSKLVHETTNKAVWNEKNVADDYSPFHLSDNITAPLLLIANKQDSVVPYQHSKDMAGRLKRKKKAVEYVEIKEGEHWRSNEESELATFQAMEAFLSKHL